MSHKKVIAVGPAMMNPKKDPNGLMARDLVLLRKTFPRRAYSPNMTNAEIMYEEGKQYILDYIEAQLLK